ncbi:MAG: tetratricopeptide repeat protein [Candidatus Riflebacteria bacterium]|nr:tetratricopeptide repeat protein [Candidatus Riflebacteria bacterium]
MLPPSLALVQRFLGILVCLLLIVSPWLVATNAEDPFLLQGWATLAMGTLASAFLAVLLLFFQPRTGLLPLLLPALAAFICLVAALLPSTFLVSLRISLLLATQLLLLFFLHLTRSRRDIPWLTRTLILSGFLMSVYALAQWLGADPISWVGSPYRVVGTFSNPNFLAAYLLVTGLLTTSLVFQGRSPGWARRLFWGAVLAAQVAALGLTNCGGALVCFGVGLLLLATRFWEIPTGRVFRRSPFLSGAVLALFLIGGYWLVTLATRNYPWDTLSRPPIGYLSVTSRLLEWQMGFAAFLSHPVLGLGPGGLSYVMTRFRPPLATALGLAPYNDDPHSHVLLLLGETGVPGLVAFCSLLAALLGIHARFRFRQEHAALHPEGPPPVNPGPGPILPPPAPVPGTAPAPEPTPPTAPPAGEAPGSPTPPPPTSASPEPAPLQAPPPTLMANAGSPPDSGTTAGPLAAKAATADAWLPKGLAAAGLALFCHALFNNTLSVLPLANLLLLVAALHQAACLPDLRWKRRFSWRHLPLLLVPFAFTIAAWTLQANHQEVARGLFEGRSLLLEGRPVEAEASFERVLRANPQSLHGIWGLAQSMEGQGRLARVQDLLGRLDALGPNIFGAKLHLARILFERNQILEAHRYAIMNLALNQAPATYELLGRILVTEGRIAEAEQILREGLLLVPTWIDEEREAAQRIRLQLAAILIDQGKTDEARRFLDQVGPSPDLGGEPSFLRGVIAHRNALATEALALFEEALTHNASDPKYLNAVGFLLVEKNGDLNRAQTLLEEAYRGYRTRNPPLLSDILTVAHSLGRLYWKQGRLDKAQELLTIAYQQCPLDWKESREERARDLKRFFQETGRPSIFPEEVPLATGTP